MSDLERRLEDLFAEDARARHVRGVRVTPRGPGWPAAAALIAATAVTTVLAVLLLVTFRPGLDRPASPTAATSPTAVTSPSPTPSETPVLSEDQKSVVVDGQVLLAIDDDQIVEWFRTKSQLCHEPNRRTPDRRMFCENKASFRDQIRFASVVVSPDGRKIGFTIETASGSALAQTHIGDRAAGIFLRSTGNVHFLSYLYYLGNQFIGFSPTGTNFVHQGGCYNAMCGLFIIDSETLAERASLNNPGYMQERHQSATFVRWISDNEVEYRLGTELRRESF
ncbi:MAG: hypothetical protein ACRDGE_11005 [Candidatus Limnocylindria bacterium]